MQRKAKKKNPPIFIFFPDKLMKESVEGGTLRQLSWQQLTDGKHVNCFTCSLSGRNVLLFVSLAFARWRLRRNVEDGGCHVVQLELGGSEGLDAKQVIAY